MLRPVSSQCAEVMVERAVFLRQENDVIENSDVGRRVKGGSDLLARAERQCAGRAVAAATASPSGET